MPLPEARQGAPLEIAKQKIAFSFWPVGRTNRRYRVQHRIFAADPWPLIFNQIENNCPQNFKKPAFAFCNQAEDLYKTSFYGRELFAKPLLLYYSMLNLAKAFILTTNNGSANYRPTHGLSEKATERQNAGAMITATVSQNRRSAYNDFLYAISGRQLNSTHHYRLGDILPQILTGHRVWCAAANANERFVAINDLRFLVNPENHAIWVQLSLKDDDVKRLHVSYKKLLDGTLLGPGWRVARSPQEQTSICIEKEAPHTYRHRPGDDLMNVVAEMRKSLWSSVLLVPPYRKYYLYTSPRAGHRNALPQLLSIYMIMFFLGSITRYRPHHFDALLQSPYGPQIEGFLNEAPSQFLYLVASEFLKQEVSKPATV